MKERELEGKPEVLERLNYELDIIKFKGYAMYFLVVEDLIRFAREHGILNNIRGSVAGSMTTYLLEITKIDPLEYKIPFERFLNPERPSAPDIDMDFADDRREEVINYARAKYGEDHVAQIGTFGTMLARGVVRDVARALRYPYGLGDRIAKEIPFGQQGFPMTLDRALGENPELKKMYDAEDETREIIELGKKIEGNARHVGVHAAGVVISPRPLVEYAPLQLDPKGGKIITQYDMYSVGEDGVGLTKFDFLGIRNLTILKSAVDLIEKIRGVTVDIENIPLNDKKTFEMLARGETEGTFQLNGAGMTKWLVELRPTTIHDINAMVALYRPGPMQFIPDYIKRKHNSFLISYLDPAMEPILKQTYGVLVYQDDLLMMANQLAGYTWGEVDKFRKAVGKKIPEEMAAQKEKFIKGCIEHSKWPAKKAQEVWAWIEPFAAYGFNKAHSASYGRVAYQTAYLKANYPVEYMAAVLTAESGDVETITVMVNECKRMHINVLAPDVNESFGDFTVVAAPQQIHSEESLVGQGVMSLPRQAPQPTSPPVPIESVHTQAIRFGLYSIKNFGRGVADSIIDERKANGKFTSLADFLSRVADQNLNKKGLESLIQGGALDSLGERGQMLASIELLLQYHRDSTKDSSHDSLFAAMGTGPAELTLPQSDPATTEVKLAWEKELLGLYVSGHPLDKHKERLAKRRLTLGKLKEMKPGITTITGGMIEDVRVILTKKGDQMAFIKIADYDGSIEAVVFPKSYAEHKDIIKPDSCIALKGKLSSRNGELSLVAEGLKAL
jgi:DNA polymerase-3 subunit alpha